MFWQTTRFRIDLSQPRVMGIVNVTPDSFSDGGRLTSSAAALAHCERLVGEGAELLDIGGESSRPGALPVSLDEELARVLPVLDGALRLGVPISVDTTKTEVMRQALARGADIVNDIGALQAPGAAELLASHASAGVCLMHMRGDPASMQSQARYTDVVAEVSDFLRERLRVLASMGVARERIALDPGIGFGKSVEHNLDLLRRQHAFADLGQPLLVGWSRKSTLGSITGRDVSARLPASLAAALISAERGAHIVRVHDVAATVDVLKVWRAAGPAEPVKIVNQETPRP